ncbi:MAG TPA: DHHA1 domain-containing protein [Candidatus Nanoarchaeia archaeon]|nr:DHHA1 domain-containing protein [Candidatus Nanoarchaeia archaeon]
MLTEKELTEIREILESSQNPIYFFDGDGDGLSSYLNLKKHYKKGLGVPVKSGGPEGITSEYLKYVDEEKPDLVVILDKAVLTQEFIDKIPCQILILDHHPPIKLKKVKYYNPQLHGSNVPTSYLAYQVTKTNAWIAAIGCLFDYFIPDFLDEIKEYIEDKEYKTPGDITYNTKLGEMIKTISFIIKGKHEDVKKSLKALEKINSLNEIFNKSTPEGKFIRERYERLNKEYEKLLSKAKSEATRSKLFLFIYPSQAVSFTVELSNELCYRYPKKTIIVGREKENKIAMSLRDQNRDISKILEISLKGLEGYGGGHEHACGCAVSKKDFNMFIERIKQELK